MSTSAQARLLHAPAPKRPARRFGVQLFLALFLLLAQTGLFLHELEHQSSAPDAYCALCLAAQHLGDALHVAQSLGHSSLQALPPPARVFPAMHAAPGVPFSARAPPVPA